MADENSHKTYGLESVGDLVKKLDWEIQQLDDASKFEVSELCYHAYNAIMTAWHLVDWTWHALGEERKAKLKEEQEVKNIGQFRRLLRRSNKGLAICREVATASKHFSIEQGADSTIATRASGKTARILGADGLEIATDSGYVVALAWTLKVDVEDETLELVEVLKKVRLFWGEYLAEEGIPLS